MASLSGGEKTRLATTGRAIPQVLLDSPRILTRWHRAPEALRRFGGRWCQTEARPPGA
jgi:hypothetical protein